MEGLPEAFFHLAEIDGKTAVFWMRVCKAWRRQVLRCPRLLRLIGIHQVVTNSYPAFERELGPYKLISQKRASELTNDILFHKHGFNGFLTKIRRSSCVMETMQTERHFTLDMLVKAFFKYGEAADYVQNQQTGDLMIINDYYGWATQNATPEKYEDNLRFLEQCFPGTFLWKQVVFPPHVEYPFITIRKKSFHRGDCMVITLKNPFGMQKQPTVLPELRKQALGSLKKRRAQNDLEQEIDKKIKF